MQAKVLTTQENEHYSCSCKSVLLPACISTSCLRTGKQVKKVTAHIQSHVHNITL